MIAKDAERRQPGRQDSGREDNRPRGGGHRLLRSSLEHSYEPNLDIDWNAPLVDGAYGMSAHRVSLYGTELWDQLTEEQRITLSIHEVCSVARVGLWFRDHPDADAAALRLRRTRAPSTSSTR